MATGDIATTTINTTKESYPFELISDIDFYRPSTSNPFRAPFRINDPIGVSHYDHEFYGKKYSKRELIRTGSASGTRNNQPQPTKEFLGWRYKPEKPVTNPNSAWSRELTEDAIRRVMKSQLKSVYTNDYADIMRRVELAHLNEKNKSLPQLPNIQQQRDQQQQHRDNNNKLQTEQRFHYQIPQQPLLLRNPTTRFGSRK